MSRFRKATKTQARLRCALYGPSGSGKTMSALRIAAGLGGTIAVIDTERGSASKYADRFEFAVLDLEDRTVDGYLAAIGEAASEGFAVLILDSLSHAWQELLDEVDRLSKNSRNKGNRWSAWSEGTPKQRALVDAILGYPGHVIGTMRSKTEWAQEDDGRGKKKPVRVGLAPEQGKGIEYEFDLLIAISQDHIATVEKDRTGKFQDVDIDRPGEDFGRALAEWLGQGEAATPAPAANGNGATGWREAYRLRFQALDAEYGRPALLEAAAAEGVRLRDVIEDDRTEEAWRVRYGKVKARLHGARKAAEEAPVEEDVPSEPEEDGDPESPEVEVRLVPTSRTGRAAVLAEALAVAGVPDTRAAMCAAIRKHLDAKVHAGSVLDGEIEPEALEALLEAIRSEGATA